MLTDSVLKNKAMDVLIDHLGLVDTERFISLISKEPFDYTRWQAHLFEDVSVEELSKAAMSFQQKNFPQQ